MCPKQESACGNGRQRSGQSGGQISAGKVDEDPHNVPNKLTVKQ